MHIIKVGTLNINDYAPFYINTDLCKQVIFNAYNVFVPI